MKRRRKKQKRQPPHHPHDLGTLNKEWIVSGQEQYYMDYKMGKAGEGEIYKTESVYKVMV